MHIIIASDQERDKVFAELYHDDELWAEVSIVDSTQEVVIRLFSDAITLPYDEAMALLQKAYAKVTAPTASFDFDE